MKLKRSNAPVFWLLFGAGGMLSALFGTALVFLTGIATPRDASDGAAARLGVDSQTFGGCGQAPSPLHCLPCCIDIPPCINMRVLQCCKISNIMECAFLTVHRKVLLASLASSIKRIISLPAEISPPELFITSSYV